MVLLVRREDWVLIICIVCMQNSENPGRIQMERFIPMEIFRKKRNSFGGITFFTFLPKKTEIFRTICLDY